MKLRILLITALVFNTLIFTDPLLVAVLMVKNEEAVMEMTLQPLVDAGITDFLIYDTGSTDDTIQITQDFFINNNITNFVIEQGEFIDFATSRNKALELTELYFPDATFMLMLDAEWILHNGIALLQCCEQEKNNLTALYHIKLTGSDINFYHPRLIRCGSNIHFVGKVHEIPNIMSQAKIYDAVYFEYSPSGYGQEKSKNRWLRDCDLLLKELQKNPNDARTIYYLGQTYFALGDFSNAIKWCQYRTTISGWDEEDFLAFFVLAQAYEKSGNFQKMIYTYLQAFNIRSHRAEPLIKLAEYYYKIKSFHLCYLFARHACTIAYPKDDVAMVDKQAYEFIRYALLSAAAHIVGDYNLGKTATLKALQARPDQLYLQKNLEYYQTMLT
jgi:tetratricopeptide (TPR) repeat protein